MQLRRLRMTMAFVILRLPEASEPKAERRRTAKDLQRASVN
jgi:hypothetical protein